MKINKQGILCVILCYVMLLCSCGNGNNKYRRISFESDTLEERLSFVSEDTVVNYDATGMFPTQLPIYEISERVISDNERQILMANLEIPTNPYYFEHKGNKVSIMLASYTDSSKRGYFTKSETELEDMAWKAFKQIPFMEGEYEYVGFRGEQSVSIGGVKRIERVLVSFFRLVDGVRVVGESQCDMWFDGSGLVEIHLNLFDYEKTGAMDVVPLSEAATKVNCPDDFSIEGAMGVADTLKVNNVEMFMVNQYSRGCAILQPIYTFYGTAYFEDNMQKDFSSKVIAIPESMTYEEE